LEIKFSNIEVILRIEANNASPLVIFLSTDTESCLLGRWCSREFNENLSNGRSGDESLFIRSRYLNIKHSAVLMAFLKVKL
jgi:hypothetical protein